MQLIYYYRRNKNIEKTLALKMKLFDFSVSIHQYLTTITQYPCFLLKKLLREFDILVYLYVCWKIFDSHALTITILIIFVMAFY